MTEPPGENVAEEPLLPQPTAPEEDVVREAQEPQEMQEAQEPRRPYPDPFYCPLTEKVMEDPVVGPDGASFERSAALIRDAADDASPPPTYYPNRALKIIIEQEKRRVAEEGTALGALRRAEASLRAGFEQILEKSAFPTAERRPLPDAYYCPITLDLISRPAIGPDGNTYERRAIVNWIQENGTSPLTRNELREDQLRDNAALEGLIDAEANKGEYSIHPSMRRLKESRLEEADEDADLEAARRERENRLQATGERLEAELPGETLAAEQDKKWVCTCVGLLFAIIAIVAAFFFFPAEGVIGVLFIVCSCFCDGCTNNGGDDDN